MSSLLLARAASLAVLLAGLAACGGDGGSGGGSVHRTDGSEPTADDRAAAAFVRSRLDQHWSKLPDGWTTQFEARNVFGQVIAGTPPVLFQQLRQLEFAIEPEGLTEAQRLNGADYRCVAAFRPTPTRYYRPVANWEGPQGWSSWEDGALTLRRLAVERRKGEWLLQDDDLFQGSKPDPSEMP